MVERSADERAQNDPDTETNNEGASHGIAECAPKIIAGHGFATRAS